MTTNVLKPIPEGKSKADGAARMLERLIRQVGPGGKLPRVRDLCKTMEISWYTVDAALKDLENRGLLYRKHGSGLFVAPLVKTRRIAMVRRRDIVEGSQGHADSHFLLIDSLRSEGRERNAMLTCYTYDPQHDKEQCGPQPIEWDIQNGRVDGIILAGMDNDQCEQIQAIGVPCAIFSGDVAHLSAQVCWDHSAMVEMGVRSLLREGRRKIGLAYAVHADGSAYANSLELFGQALRKEGIEEDPRWRMPFSAEMVRLRALDASRRFHQLWDSKEHPDALLSLDDQYTAGLLHAAEMLHVRIPRDLLVASHSNKGLNLFGETSVARLEFNLQEIARRLLQNLDDLLVGRSVPAVQSVPPELVYSGR